jgi:Ser/Thr protein kinase RdoA (MazF antagonist)
MIDYSHLNHYVPPVAEGISAAWKRALARLGEYTATVVRALNVRPTAVTLAAQTEAYLLVRITTQHEHLILRFAPEDDLAAYTYFCRALSGQNLPGTPIIQRDLTCTLVPFAYTLERHVPGVAAATLTADHLLHAAGRQAGRTLRRLHRILVPSAGRPTPGGRWPADAWPSTLRQIGRRLAPPPTDSLVFSAEARATVSGLLADPRLDLRRPVLMHGAFSPRAVRCTAAEHVHLEALVEPGAVIGGDGLYDLACGLRPAFPAAWRAGLLEGYCAATPLNPEETERLLLLRLLACYWGACNSYMRAEPHAADHEETLRLLAELYPGYMLRPVEPPAPEPQPVANRKTIG